MKSRNGDSRPSDERPLGPLEISRRTRYAILLAVWTGAFLSVRRQTLVPTRSHQASWLGTSYLLATCTFTHRMYGRLCNALGRKEQTLLALTFCAAGILLCGLSRNMETLIAARFSRGLPQGFQSVFAALGMGLGGAGNPRRIDYGGSITLMMAVGTSLLTLRSALNAFPQWSHPTWLSHLALIAVCSVLFVIVEIYVALEPVLAPHLLKQRIPVLVGMSNFCVAMCNFSIMYFFPMWFQTVLLTSAFCLHLVPNCVSIYKRLNLILGILPFVGATLIYRLQEDSNFFPLIPLGFGNAVVLQTMLIALLVHLPESDMAVGTGFGVLWRGVGQVGGVAVSSAIFQSRLDSQLRQRITGPGAAEIIQKIRHNARLVATLPPRERLAAQESYKASLKSVFFFAACMTLCAYIVRLPVRGRQMHTDKQLEHHPKRNRSDEEESASSTAEDASTPSSRRSSSPVLSVQSDRRFTRAGTDVDTKAFNPSHDTPGKKRRLSTYDTADQVSDPEIRYGTRVYDCLAWLTGSDAAIANHTWCSLSMAYPEVLGCIETAFANSLLGVV
ncbi:multidrug resistance protein [Coprinopsis sp. MPI-PUGE-AT-0042]|nr:multidrug resistance protein [Coprinopsis sp. MPI-PUGE-AT-0042]